MVFFGGLRFFLKIGRGLGGCFWSYLVLFEGIGGFLGGWNFFWAVEVLFLQVLEPFERSAVFWGALWNIF